MINIDKIRYTMEKKYNLISNSTKVGDGLGEQRTQFLDMADVMKKEKHKNR